MGTTFSVEVLDSHSLRLACILPRLGEDDFRYTFRIQDADSNVGYAMFGGDSTELNIVEAGQLTRYLRLPERPDIQLIGFRLRSIGLIPLRCSTMWLITLRSLVSHKKR